MLNKINYLYSDFKDFLYLNKTNTNVENPKIVLITGIPRSGTTWFGEMFNTIDNIVIHEPFKEYTTFWNWNLNEFPGDLNAIKAVLEKIISFNYWKRYQKKIKLNNNNHFITKNIFHIFLKLKKKNIIIKDPCVSYFLNYFKENKKFDSIVVIYRHPYSLISSLVKLKWDPKKRLELLFNHPEIRENFPNINNDFNLDELNLFQKTTLQTSLLHYLCFKNQKDCIVLFYEDFAENPIQKFENLFNTLKINYDQDTIKLHKKLSFNTTKNIKNTHDVERNSQDEIEKYKNHLTEDEIAYIKIIYTKFNSTNIYTL